MKMIVYDPERVSPERRTDHIGQPSDGAGSVSGPSRRAAPSSVQLPTPTSAERLEGLFPPRPPKPWRGDRCCPCGRNVGSLQSFLLVTA